MTSIPRESLSLINPEYGPLVNTAMSAVSISLAALFAPIEAIRIVGMTVITGAIYGIANDMIACRDCIEYFTVGHFYDGKNFDFRPIHTLDPNLNAFFWGIIATWHVCAIAGAIFACLARLPFAGLAIKVSAAQLAPYLAIGAAISFFVSHKCSRFAQKQMQKHPFNAYFGVPLKHQAGWEACNVRNSTGYIAVGVGGVLLSIAIIAARAGLIRL